MSTLNFDALKKQVAALSTAIAGKQAERASIAAEIAAVNSAPASRADLKQMVFDWVDASAAQYSNGLKLALEPFIGNWTRGPTKENPLELLHRINHRNTAGIHVTPGPEGLFFLLNKEIKAALSDAVDSLDLPDGLDKAARTAQLKSLASQMGAIDNELAELTDLANSAGINAAFREDLPHEREAKRLAVLAEKRAADEAKRKARQDSMPCGDFPSDRQTLKPRPSEISEFEKGQVRIDGLAANRGG